jgi:hypothetical protein
MPLDSNSSYRVLLLGANGQLGFALDGALKALGEVKALTRSEADLSNAFALRDTIPFYDVGTSEYFGAFAHGRSWCGRMVSSVDRQESG